ncbi:MAG: cyclic pyranopterin monophosphate synthase MoaC [Myxococcota bacterium]
MSDDDLTHVDAAGNARMVDVGAKDETVRSATARGVITLSDAALRAVVQRSARKGDVLTVAQIAGITGAKRTADLIPLCHPLALSGVDVTFEVDEVHSRIVCTAWVRTRGRTGVEMEALTAVSAALLTVYDMLKAVDRSMAISDIVLLHKEGGRTGTWSRDG